MLGVHRSTVIRVARPLQEDGAIRYRRAGVLRFSLAGAECSLLVLSASVASFLLPDPPAIVDRPKVS